MCGKKEIGCKGRMAKVKGAGIINASAIMQGSNRGETIPKSVQHDTAKCESNEMCSVGKARKNVGFRRSRLARSYLCPEAWGGLCAVARVSSKYRERKEKMRSRVVGSVCVRACAHVR